MRGFNPDFSEQLMITIPTQVYNTASHTSCSYKCSNAIKSDVSSDHNQIVSSHTIPPEIRDRDILYLQVLLVLFTNLFIFSLEGLE